MRTHFYDMRDFVNTIAREVNCLQCQVQEGGGGAGKEDYPYGFTTIEGQLSYTTTIPNGAQLVSVIVENNSLNIGTQVFINTSIGGATISFTDNYGDGQRVYIIYKV